MRAYASRFYDGYFLGVAGDLAFYAARAKEADGAVLEVGCGSGRITLALAGAGAEVVGLDHDPDMLALALVKSDESGLAIDWIEGDMAEFDLGRRFAQIQVPYRTFQHLLTPADQIRALHCMADHLVDGGLLLFDSFDPLGQMAAEGFSSPLRKDTDFVDSATGHQVVVYYSRASDPQTQILEQELIFEEIDGNGVAVDRTFTRLLLRWSTRWELEHLLAGCGFEVVTLDGDFSGGAYPGYGNQVWTVRKV